MGQDNRHTYPTLHRMALDFLSVPGTSYIFDSIHSMLIDINSYRMCFFARTSTPSLHSELAVPIYYMCISLPWGLGKVWLALHGRPSRSRYKPETQAEWERTQGYWVNTIVNHHKWMCLSVLSLTRTWNLQPVVFRELSRCWWWHHHVHRSVCTCTCDGYGVCRYGYGVQVLAYGVTHAEP